MKIETREIDIKRGIVQLTTLDERWYSVGKDYYPSSSWIASYYPKGKQFEKWLMEKGLTESEEIKMTAGNRGSKVHQAIEMLLTCSKCHKPCVGKCTESPKHVGQELKMDDKLMNQDGVMEEISVEEWEAIMSFVGWYKKFNPEILQIERTVLNKKYGYAGTLDLKCIIDGVISIVDYKTSSSIYPSHEIQLSSYKHAEGNEDVEKTYILQVGYKKNKDRFKFTEVEDKFDIFLHTRAIWDNENKDVSPKQREYPLSLKL